MKTVRLLPLAQKEFGKTSLWVRLLESSYVHVLLVLMIVTVLSMYESFARKERKKRSQRR